MTGSIGLQKGTEIEPKFNTDLLPATHHYHKGIKRPLGTQPKSPLPSDCAGYSPMYFSVSGGLGP